MDSGKPTREPHGDAPTAQPPGSFRWLLVAGGLLLQFSIGAVYAWSVFGGALESADSWQLSTVRASLPFTVTIGMIFVGTYLGGRLQDLKGPRVVALIGGIIYALGILLASFTDGADDYWLLILGYGIISGFGLGFAYIVPIAMLQKWFPDKTGLITGLAVGGFGFGAVLTSPVAQWLIDRNPDDPTSAFLPLGIAYLVMSLAGAALFRNPPEGYTVPGFEPTGSDGSGSDRGKEYTQGEALRTPQWYLLTAILTLCVTAGISLISQAKPSASDIAGFSASGAAALVGALAIFNGAGRIVWAAISDRIGRMKTFTALLVLQGVCLIVLPHASGVVLFSILAAIIYLCYGGAFGTMPATAGDFFGVRNAGAIYGLMLIGWSIGGIIGPIIASTLLGDDKAYTLAYTTIGIIALVSVALTVITKVPAARRESVPARS
ncbi:MFS transporter, OFA family, oxalate/formate antiporter [Rhodococcus rhodochrous J3]|uniref:MFS transporter, OFA family, oxalate/formate antiporter n=1 Tax=Rhodococcus rhodochrous J3 TaxID=903528 RepID=A0ABY1M3W8_RHORH|nr:OFA family MFS transporter [Rhodococcus rhodochrous]SMG05835.1 MFS transporter, OFA family, oxalate/formate antiporter [Rhodococcus rhodochrous J3]